MYDECGYDVYGMEIHESILEDTRTAANEAEVDVTLDMIESPEMQYEENHFQIVVSWNAVYYFGSRPLVASALQEFYRVIDEGGCLLLSVIHPNSFMVQRLSDDLGEGKYRIEDSSPHDNRQNSEIFYEPTSGGWRSLLSNFDEVREGYVEFDLFDPKRRNARRLFLARKNHSN
jgi:SAM-dependent methyltransferase